ncbi:Uncharacterised protein [Bifidobacterium breve]|nr:Uncharacterised protein [Bifidobacterium breve]
MNVVRRSRIQQPCGGHGQHEQRIEPLDRRIAVQRSAGSGTLAKLNEVLGFGKTELLPTDKQVGVALAPEAWGHRQAHPVR